MAERAYRFEIHDGETVLMEGLGKLDVHTNEWVAIGGREYKVRRIVNHISANSNLVVVIYEV